MPLPYSSTPHQPKRRRHKPTNNTRIYTLGEPDYTGVQFNIKVPQVFGRGTGHAANACKRTQKEATTTATKYTRKFGGQPNTPLLKPRNSLRPTSVSLQSTLLSHLAADQQRTRNTQPSLERNGQNTKNPSYIPPLRWRSGFARFFPATSSHPG